MLTEKSWEMQRHKLLFTSMSIAVGIEKLSHLEFLKALRGAFCAVHSHWVGCFHSKNLPEIREKLKKKTFKNPKI